jgi:hypothetical protein
MEKMAASNTNHNIFLERTAKALPLFLLDDEKKKQSGGLVFLSGN